MSRIQWSIDSVKEFVDNKTDCELLSTEYVNAKTKLKFKCVCGREFERTWDNFLRKKTYLCRSCSNIRPLPKIAKRKISRSRLKPIEEVIKIVEVDMKCRFIKRYIRENTRSTIIVFECPKHGIQEVYWTNLVKRKGCPVCNEFNKQNSKGMLRIEDYLKSKSIKFIKEYKFDECVDKRKLPFDYYIPEKNTCIEFDGRQHFEKAYFGGADEEKASYMLEYVKRHDNIKNNFCKKNSINLIRIPYFEIDNIEKILKSAF